MLRACLRRPGAPRWPVRAGYPIVKSPVSFAATGQPMVLGQMKRRDFITLLGGAAASPLLWPLAARAQQPAVPVVGFLNSGTPAGLAYLTAAFRQGLSEAGYVEGRNVAIVPLVARHRLPAIYSDPAFVRVGGLAYYGSDRVDQFRRAAGYVDRILRGEKPGDLPFQQPTKYQFIVNLKTAKAMGLDLPPTLVALADEVIE
jgi:ABC transporter substrate binding protein